MTVREFVKAGAALLGAGLSLGGQESAATKLKIGGAAIEVTLGEGGFDLGPSAILAWVTKAAKAVIEYYGVFPVPQMRIRVNPSERRSGVFGGTTWGQNPPFTRIFVGRHTTQAELDDDWMMTHELVHTAFPDVDEDHHWIEEGIATYVEPIARVQIGDLQASRIWGDMARDMPKGEPQAFDEGLDHTHTWGRTYWGGALFCLVADVRIRQASQNRKGLQDALRGIRAAGGTIEHHWALESAFAVGDQATHTKVLSKLYSEMKDQPYPVDLNALWSELGVKVYENTVSLDERAPLAAIRRSITLPT
ncbi:MAG TPA: hypothetical protein VGL97_04645 [Bryobacteraceae bacterium]